MNNTILIKVKNLYTELHSGKKHTKTMSNASFTINKGAKIGIVGESGSGKTQLFKTITGTQDMIPGIVNGSVEINFNNNFIQMYNKTKNNYKLNDKHKVIKKEMIGFIPQDPKSYLNPYWTIKEMFLTTYNLKNREININDFIEYYLNLVDINPVQYISKYSDQLSGGQSQRLMIALVLSKEPELIIADEVTTGLDVSRQKKVIETFQNIHIKKPDITTVFISHDFGFLTHVVDEYYVIYKGKIVDYIENKEKLSNIETLDNHTKELINSLSSNPIINNKTDKLNE